MDLAAVKKQLSSAPDECRQAVTNKMETMFQTIDRSLKTMYGVMAELRPVILDDFGLSAAIDWQAEEFEKRTSITCQRNIDETPRDLAKTVATVVFRIFQELLTNIMRHAGAKTVNVKLLCDHNRLVLQVADDGCGITEAQINDPGSFGLIGIRERLHPWSGTVRFQGSASRGTQVTITLPLHIERQTHD